MASSSDGRSHPLDREPAREIRDLDLDHEAAARRRGGGRVVEARDLRVLRQQVDDRVEHQVTAYSSSGTSRAGSTPSSRRRDPSRHPDGDPRHRPVPSPAAARSPAIGLRRRRRALRADVTASASPIDQLERARRVGRAGDVDAIGSSTRRLGFGLVRVVGRRPSRRSGCRAPERRYSRPSGGESALAGDAARVEDHRELEREADPAPRPWTSAGLRVLHPAVERDLPVRGPHARIVASVSPAAEPAGRRRDHQRGARELGDAAQPAPRCAPSPASTSARSGRRSPGW